MVRNELRSDDFIVLPGPEFLPGSGPLFETTQGNRRMRRFQRVPTVDGLERRELLSAVHHVHATRAEIRHENLAVHKQVTPPISMLPFVAAGPGVWQNALNFTSFRFNKIVGELNTAFASGTATSTALTPIAHEVPYGVSDGLLSTWEADTSASQAETDLVTYLDTGVGLDFNVLQSGQTFSTDAMLTFNGTVATAPTAPKPA